MNKARFKYLSLGFVIFIVIVTAIAQIPGITNVAWFLPAATNTVMKQTGYNNGAPVYGPSKITDNGTNLFYNGTPVATGSPCASTVNILKGNGSGGCISSGLSGDGVTLTWTNDNYSLNVYASNHEIVAAQSFPSSLAGVVGQNFRNTSNGGFAWLSGGSGSYAGNTDTQLTRLSSGIVSVDTVTARNSLGSLKAASFYGPATAPTGPCPGLSGAWVPSGDGHLSYCDGTSWSVKI